MATVQEIIDDLGCLSEKLSEITRTISLSVLAFVWLFLAGGKDVPTLSTTPSHALLLLSALFVSLSMLLDYFQYVAGYANSKKVLSIAEASDAQSAKFNTKSFLYRSRAFFFWAKQVLALAGLIALFVAIGRAYVGG